MREHYSQYDSVESVTSAYIALALLAGAIVAVSALPTVVGVSVFAAAAVATAAGLPSADGGSLLAAVRPDEPLADEQAPDCCPQ